MSSTKIFGPFDVFTAHANEPVPADFVQRRRLSQNLRALSERLVRAELDEPTFAALADQLENLLEQIGHPEQRDTRQANRKVFGGQATVDDVFHMMEFDAVGGAANPLLPDITWLQQDAKGVEGEVTFSLPYQGPPGRVHGGILSLLLDGVMSRALHAGMRIGMTGTLTLKYLAASPLHEPLRCRGEISGQEGRKIFVSGGVWHGDIQTVAAEGVWLMPKF